MNSLVTGRWSDLLAMDYYPRVEGIRPDLALVARWSMSDDSLRLLVEENIGQRPIYLLWDVPSLRTSYQLIDAGLWFRVEPSIEEGVADRAQ